MYVLVCTRDVSSRTLRLIKRICSTLYVDPDVSDYHRLQATRVAGPLYGTWGLLSQLDDARRKYFGPALKAPKQLTYGVRWP